MCIRDSTHSVHLSGTHRFFEPDGQVFFVNSDCYFIWGFSRYFVNACCNFHELIDVILVRKYPYEYNLYPIQDTKFFLTDSPNSFWSCGLSLVIFTIWVIIMVFTIKNNTIFCFNKRLIYLKVKRFAHYMMRHPQWRMRLITMSNSTLFVQVSPFLPHLLKTSPWITTD